jgi:hypothetical protein
MVIMATKQHSYDSDGKDEDINKYNRVTFHNVTISHKRGLRRQARDDNGSGLETAMANKRSCW